MIGPRTEWFARQPPQMHSRLRTPCRVHRTTSPVPGGHRRTGTTPTRKRCCAVGPAAGWTGGVPGVGGLLQVLLHHHLGHLRGRVTGAETGSSIPAGPCGIYFLQKLSAMQNGACFGQIYAHFSLTGPIKSISETDLHIFIQKCQKKVQTHHKNATQKASVVKTAKSHGWLAQFHVPPGKL